MFVFLQELNKQQSQLENAHSMIMRHHEQTHELESKQQRSVHHLREDHINRQHSTELTNQEEYMKRAQRELKKKHGLEIKQQVCITINYAYSFILIVGSNPVWF